MTPLAPALVTPGPTTKALGIGEASTSEPRHIGARDLIRLGIVLGERHGAARGRYEGWGAVELIDADISARAGHSGSMRKNQATADALLAGGSDVAGLFLARQGGRGQSTPTESLSSPSDSRS